MGRHFAYESSAAPTMAEAAYRLAEGASSASRIATTRLMCLTKRLNWRGATTRAPRSFG